MRSLIAAVLFFLFTGVVKSEVLYTTSPMNTGTLIAQVSSFPVVLAYVKITSSGTTPGSGIQFYNYQLQNVALASYTWGPWISATSSGTFFGDYHFSNYPYETVISSGPIYKKVGDFGLQIGVAPFNGIPNGKTYTSNGD